MLIHLPSDVLLLPDFHYGSDESKHKQELEDWLMDLCRSLEEYFKKMYYDLIMGTSTFIQTATEPDADDLQDGQLKVWDERVYAKIDGVLYRSTQMTPVSGSNLRCRVTVTS